ncbi:MAG: 4-diphosphocytidyl-2-C-methyl-D-erythritol kinase [Gemmatimonadetes bacterium]|nr:4-diphosphocytidyl-2-C-methyl-D-erythritol kinase [Gemmatimonadota bacterium]
MSAVARGARVVEVAAQAKINLRLRVLAREAGGYHQIETLFLRIDLADTVRVARTNGARSVDVSGNVDLGTIGPAEKNLAWRAAVAYLAATGQDGGFAIEIDKHIPLGSGLGGGSANAGAVLRALDAMSATPLGEAALCSIAAQIGSDVPFLTCESPFAFGWGRGERLMPLASLAARPVALVVPSFAVNTADAYGWLAESRAEQVQAFVLQRDMVSDWWQLPAIAINDFEPVVGSRHPAVHRYVQGLKSAGCEIAMMSGSGSTVFGIGPDSGADAILRPGDRLIRTRTSERVERVSPIE